MLRRYLVLSSLLVFLIPQAPASTALCQYILGYGRMDQHSDAVRAAGLFPDDPAATRSLVCAISSLAMISAKIRSSTSQPVWNTTDELARIFQESTPASSTTVDRIRNGGSLDYDVAAIARDHFSRRGIAVEVSAYGADVTPGSVSDPQCISERTSIDIEHLQTAPGEHVIIHYESWRATDIDVYKPYSQDPGFINGHSVVLTSVTGPDLSGYYHGTILDPVWDQVSLVLMKPHESKYYGIRTMLIYPGDSSHLSGDMDGTRMTMVMGAIKIRVL